ncbi:hypothetical protein [Kitasatospora sp. HPMI-4]|uniref:hypothetical protein n=1 Tax=Kitasatospora sp. HPMI-4 TaxID=3448443 RepID=UPI003F1C10FA
MAAIETVLKNAMSIDGALGAALVDSDSGMALGTRGAAGGTIAGEPVPGGAPGPQPQQVLGGAVGPGAERHVVPSLLVGSVVCSAGPVTITV